MLIDDSGSLQSTDPTDLRVVAAKLLISLLDDHTSNRAAIVRFSSRADVLAPLTPVGRDEDRRKLLEQMDRFQSEGATDLRAGLWAVAKVLESSPSDNQAFVVLLSDGEPMLEKWRLELPSGQEVSDYLEQTVEIAEDLGVSILPVSLGTEANQELMEDIARVSLGQSFTAGTALDLPAVYLEILDSYIHGRSIVGPGLVSSPGSYKLPISGLAHKVGFIIVNNSPVTAELIPPGETRALDLLGGARAYTDERFQVIIPHTLPGNGPWQVKLAGDGQAHLQAIILQSRVQIVPVMSTRERLCSGEPWKIGAKLDEGWKTGAVNQLLQGAVLAGAVTTPDGSLHDLAMVRSNSGVQKGTFDGTQTPGRYIAVLTTQLDELELSKRLEVQVENCGVPPVGIDPQWAGLVTDFPSPWFAVAAGILLLGLMLAILFLRPSWRGASHRLATWRVLPASKYRPEGTLSKLHSGRDRGRIIRPP
ncbi:MAG TPA: vWA domain-containing protein [Dehalococcoidia bacterium]|nr:vWA domain-containing protein [Dehalococcoidia bacterium]